MTSISVRLSPSPFQVFSVFSRTLLSHNEESKEAPLFHILRKGDPRRQNHKNQKNHMIFPCDFFCDFPMIFPIYDISEFIRFWGRKRTNQFLILLDCSIQEQSYLQRFRLIKDGHLPQEWGKETWDFQRICTGFVAPQGHRLGERQRRTAWWARHSKDTANDHLVQTCLY